MREGRDAVRAWTLHRIAVIQAARGDIDDAKNTVAQINDPDYVCGVADVTGVCFCNGHVAVRPSAGACRLEPVRCCAGARSF